MLDNCESHDWEYETRNYDNGGDSMGVYDGSDCTRPDWDWDRDYRSWTETWRRCKKCGKLEQVSTTD